MPKRPNPIDQIRVAIRRAEAAIEDAARDALGVERKAVKRGKRRFRPPPPTRRATPAELKRMGYSAGSKRRVKASIKRVTAKTKSYSDREIAQRKLGRTKEKETAARIQRTNLKKGGSSITYNKLNRAQLGRVLRRHRDAAVVLRIKGQGLGTMSGGVRRQWVTGPDVDADTLISKEGFDEYLNETNIEGIPQQYSLTVYPGQGFGA